jgi:DNA modification methylase
MLTQGTFFAAAAAAADILIHRQIIWQKPSLVFGRGDYHWQHELCFYGWRRGNRPPFYGPRNQTTLWAVGRETSKDHPTAKPVDLWKPPIENHTKIGEVIYEPFSGSGSQIIAAEQTARRCYAMELSPQYVDVAVRRWQQFTGKRAVHAVTGLPFPEKVGAGETAH